MSTSASASASGSKVVTVLGPIPPADLGVTLSHDHLILDAFALWGEQTGNYSWILDDVDVAIHEMEAYLAVGGRSVIDPTNEGIGRDPVALRRISEATGAHIIMGAGWYRERCYPRYVYEESVDQLADRLVTELTVGVRGTGVRAGFIGEIGTERFFISPAQERVFRASARAHRRTGAPILTHTTHFGELALEQLDLLAEEGVDSHRVIVSHLGDRVGAKWVVPIAERGAFLSIDNLGFVGGYAPLELRADNVAELCSLGFARQVMLGNDICQLDQLARYGGVGYGNVMTNFLPMLRERGVSKEQIHLMTVDNPARAMAYEMKQANSPALAAPTEEPG